MGEKYFGEDVTSMTGGEINGMGGRNEESQMWAMNGEVNGTERAIRRVRKCRKSKGSVEGIEYAHALDQEISNSVNMEC